jgi:hypothetical protein
MTRFSKMRMKWRSSRTKRRNKALCLLLLEPLKLMRRFGIISFAIARFSSMKLLSESGGHSPSMMKGKV